MTQIVINLDSHGGLAKIELGQLVHQDVYEKLRRDIRSSLRSLCSPTQQVHPPGSGLTFFIDGSRGAGKTTFLQAVYSELPGELNDDQQQDEVLSIKALDYIDPSRLEGSEIVLLNILHALKRIVEEKTCCLREEGLGEEFRRHFKKLAGGLSLFRKGYDQLAHHDPELFFDRGLARAENSHSLRNNFHRVIDTACKMLGVDALLLAFDDADTNSKHAFKLCECIRNYLDTPRLLILATGDMELYSLLIREQFSRQLPTEESDPGLGRKAQRIRMLDHLEDQYLLKLFPLPRRYQLKPLGRLLQVSLQTKEWDYQLSLKGWTDGSRSPISVLNEIIRRGLRVSAKSDVDIFREHLLKQPLRSIIQLLQRCAPCLSITDDLATDKIEWSGDLSVALRESLRAMAQGSLYKKGIVVDDLSAGFFPALTMAVFDLATEDGDVDTAAYLRPQASDEDLNNCYVALAAEVSGICAHDFSASINFLLTGPGR